VKKKKGEFHDDEEEHREEEDAGTAEEDADFAARLAHKHKTWSKEQKEDYYELLGLGNVRWRATADEIKASCMFLTVHFTLSHALTSLLHRS
jgi:hypothetical protein